MGQINLFEMLYEKYRIKKTIRMIELFGGIGSQSRSLEMLQEQGKLPLGFEHYRLVEFDKYPVASYNAIHGTNFEPTDITKIHAEDLGIVDRDKYEYIMTYSFPCQDLSIGGKMKGLSKGSGTRSGLLWEVERLLNECGNELPQVLLLENVFTIVGDKFINDFKAWQQFLESKDYSNYYELLNAKDYGIPQNRNRCFMISILGEAYYEFPKPVPLKLKLKDMLEPIVSSKYIASDKKVEYLEKKVKQGYKKKIVTSPDEIATCVCNPSRNQINDTYVYVDDKYFLSDKMLSCFTNEDTKGFNRAERFYQTLYNTNIEGMASAITTRAGSRATDNYVVEELYIKENTKQGYAIAKEGDSINLERINLKTRRGRVGHDVAQTILANCQQGVCVKDILKLRIRKLTPKECWRLMGFTDDDFEKAAKVNSNAQLYKQAGNSIVVNVLMAIFSQLL